MLFLLLFSEAIYLDVVFFPPYTLGRGAVSCLGLVLSVGRTELLQCFWLSVLCFFWSKHR